MARLSDLVRRFGGDCPLSFRGFDPEIRDVELDSRRVREAALFAALPGLSADGTRFVPDALARGAAAVLVSGTQSSGIAPLGSRAPVWAHVDARRVAGEVAAFVHGNPSEKLKVVGITGTNGKTSVAHLLTEILRRAGREPAQIGTVVYELAGGFQVASTHTTPDSPVLQRLFAQHAQHGGDSVVMEASSHALDQERLAGTALDVAVFTNLSRDHLDYHADMESYAAAKERLFRMLPAEGWAIVPAHDKVGERMARAAVERGARVATYGVDVESDLTARALSAARSGMRFEIEGMGIRRTPVALPLMGRHNVENALAALAAALVSGVGAARALGGLARSTPPPGRLQSVTGPDHPFSVVVDYAHTEAALAKTLGALREVLDERGKGRLLCVFGCGGNRDRGKREPMGRIVGELADVALATSDNPRNESPEAILEDVLKGLVGAPAETHVEVDRRRAIELAVGLARPDDIVLVAGKGHETTQEIRGKKLAFDDREVVQAALLGVPA